MQCSGEWKFLRPGVAGVTFALVLPVQGCSSPWVPSVLPQRPSATRGHLKLLFHNQQPWVE